jgi:hypothetical protein
LVLDDEEAAVFRSTNHLLRNLVLPLVKVMKRDSWNRPSTQDSPALDGHFLKERLFPELSQRTWSDCQWMVSN